MFVAACGVYSSGCGCRQGIETVRRDGCPALVKMMEKSLRLLFTSRDLSQARFCIPQPRRVR